MESRAPAAVSAFEAWEGCVNAQWVAFGPWIDLQEVAPYAGSRRPRRETLGAGIGVEAWHTAAAAAAAAVGRGTTAASAVCAGDSLAEGHTAAGTGGIAHRGCGVPANASEGESGSGTAARPACAQVYKGPAS